MASDKVKKCLTCLGNGFQVVKGKTVDCKARCKNGYVDLRTL